MRSAGWVMNSDDEIPRTDDCRYFQIGGITVQVGSDLPLSDTTFDTKFECFRTDGPGPDTVRIHHHFSLPSLPVESRGDEVYRRPPWAVYRNGDSWVYTGIPTDGADSPLHRVAVFSPDHASGEIYNDGDEAFRSGNLGSLTLFPTDQILIARLMADRQGCILHSCGVVMDGKGMLFVGHSEAGKSTTARMIAPYADILCDDRNIVRCGEDGWQVYGTWSHGDVSTVSAGPAPLSAIFFIEQARVNRLSRIEGRGEAIHRLAATVIRSLATADWWEKTLSTIEGMAREVPCYRMEFDRSGAIVRELRRL